MADFSAKFYANFIKDDRWLGLVSGLKVTIIVTLEALLLGVIIGFIVAIIRSYHDKTNKLKILNAICKVYLTVIRGTPTMIQILIMYLVVFGSSSLDSIIIGGIAFGINSGAYVAEIVRSGIMSIPIGQTEAGRSLGLNYAQTMRLIIVPQAFKNVLPALFFIITKFFSLVNAGSRDFPAFAFQRPVLEKIQKNIVANIIQI